MPCWTSIVPENDVSTAFARIHSPPPVLAIVVPPAAVEVMVKGWLATADVKFKVLPLATLTVCETGEIEYLIGERHVGAGAVHVGDKGRSRAIEVAGQVDHAADPGVIAKRGRVEADPSAVSVRSCWIVSVPGTGFVSVGLSPDK